MHVKSSVITTPRYLYWQTLSNGWPLSWIASLEQIFFQSLEIIMYFHLFELSVSLLSSTQLAILFTSCCSLE